MDKPGQLINLLQVVSKTGANVMSVVHEREDEKSEINSCVVTMVLETRNMAHVKEIRSLLKSKGYEVF